jgi:hypothetical protein
LSLSFLKLPEFSKISGRVYNRDEGDEQIDPIRDVAAMPMVFKIVTSRISIVIRLAVPENSLIGAKNSVDRPSNEFRL